MQQPLHRKTPTGRKIPIRCGCGKQAVHVTIDRHFLCEACCVTCATCRLPKVRPVPTPTVPENERKWLGANGQLINVRFEWSCTCGAY